MSGGEQRMLALARAFLAEPLVLLLDEPSLGLAPKVVDEVFAGIARFRDGGTAVVLVEQYVHRSLALADHAVVLDRGEVGFAGPAADARRRRGGRPLPRQPRSAHEVGGRRARAPAPLNFADHPAPPFGVRARAATTGPGSCRPASRS